MQSKEDFLKDVINGATALQQQYPQFRWGQSVFNYIESTYGPVARVVQLEKGVDCFYQDSYVALFIDEAYNTLKEWEENNGETMD